MIHYHGGPITPAEAAASIYAGRHAMVSFAEPRDLPLVAEVCQSFALDNGAFNLWRTAGGQRKQSWSDYYEFVDKWRRHPSFDWALIPDVIDGTEDENDLLLDEWPTAWDGVPVWHLHESIERLEMLVHDFPRVAFGSSGEWATPGTQDWWKRMNQAMAAACDEQGRPKARLHGLRMLNTAIFSQLPFASADSTNVARNIGLDKAWKGTYQPASKAIRGLVLANRIEAVQSSPVWHGFSQQQEMEFTHVH